MIAYYFANNKKGEKVVYNGTDLECMAFANANLMLADVGGVRLIEQEKYVMLDGKVVNQYKEIKHLRSN